MRVSLSWLKELVEIETTVEELSESLSMAGFEVESIDDLSSNTKGVVIGRVESVKAHPNADKLSICLVDIGQEENVQIVCGAKNVKAGFHVPVATIGTNLSAINLKIKPSEIRGIASKGMICSLQELGLSIKSEGICILEEYSKNKFIVGSPIYDLFDLDDTILELAITANRPDGMSMLGIAHEVSALTGSKLDSPELTHVNNYQKLNRENLECKALEGDTIYAITCLEAIDNTLKTPEWMRKRLQVIGIKSINAVVDITNYIMIELGQPLHAFDAEKLAKITNKHIDQNSFGIRASINQEKIVLLDGNEYVLTPDCQVITCHDIPVALAGVMGGMESSVSTSTKTIWLESAIFNPTSVRNTSRCIGVRTESSSRYEKGIATEMTLVSATRATKLLAEITKANISGAWSYQKETKKDNKIQLRRLKIRSVLGPINSTNEKQETLSKKTINKDSSNKVQTQIVEIEDEEIENTLASLGCKLEPCEEGWLVTIPPSRKKDLIREIDLIEEVARLIGYDKFCNCLPAPIEPGKLTAKQKVERSLITYFCQSGLQEVTTYSLVGRNSSTEKQAIISNPLLSELGYLRTNMYPEHLDICKRNIQAGKKYCWLFEIGNVFKIDKEKIIEKSLISGIISGEKRAEVWVNQGKRKFFDYYQARGILFKVMNNLRIEVKDDPLKDHPLLHPGRSVEIIIEGRSRGFFGQIHPQITEDMEIPKDSYLFEIELEPVLQAATRPNKWIPLFRQFSLKPSLERDIALIVDRNMNSLEIVNSIIKSGKPLLENVELIDRYEGDSLGDGKCSLAFRLTYRHMDRTLSDPDIQPTHEKIRNNLKSQYSAELRS